MSKAAGGWHGRGVEKARLRPHGRDARGLAGPRARPDGLPLEGEGRGGATPVAHRLLMSPLAVTCEARAALARATLT